jgi:hypothetical protein
VPTYFRTNRFIRDYGDLTDGQREHFKVAVSKFVEDLKRDGEVRSSLGIRPLQRCPGVFEFHFEGDGRATFSYGETRVKGEVHIDWRRIGSHSVYKDP